MGLVPDGAELLFFPSGRPRPGCGINLFRRPVERRRAARIGLINRVVPNESAGYFGARLGRQTGQGPPSRDPLCQRSPAPKIYREIFLRHCRRSRISKNLFGQRKIIGRRFKPFRKKGAPPFKEDEAILGNLPPLRCSSHSRRGSVDKDLFLWIRYRLFNKESRRTSLVQKYFALFPLLLLASDVGAFIRKKILGSSVLHDSFFKRFPSRRPPTGWSWILWFFHPRTCLHAFLFRKYLLLQKIPFCSDRKKTFVSLQAKEESAVAESPFPGRLPDVQIERNDPFPDGSFGGAATRASFPGSFFSSRKRQRTRRGLGGEPIQFLFPKERFRPEDRGCENPPKARLFL